MKLFWSPRSPFVRKVMIVVHETGLAADVECVRETVALHLPPNQEVLRHNPLGKIPALITNEGKTLFDSRVICEYLDTRAASGLFPADPDARFDHLRWQALGDGLTDILLIWRTELTREAGPWQAIAEGWQAKVTASMTQLEQEAGTLASTSFGIGQIAVVCALGQLDFRWPDCAWRDHFPGLKAFESAMAGRASVQTTAIAADAAGEPDEVTSGRLTF